MGIRGFLHGEEAPSVGVTADAVVVVEPDVTRGECVVDDRGDNVIDEELALCATAAQLWGWLEPLLVGSGDDVAGVERNGDVFCF